MRHRRLAPVAAVLGALALPASADAIDRVSLQLEPVELPGKPAWRLTGTAPGPEFFGGTEIVGVTLRRTSRSGAVEEAHALRTSLGIRTFSFDGTRGTWRSQKLLGDVLTVNMRISAIGPARPVVGYLSCRGDFVEQTVVLRGTFVLRTRTRFFGTIRRTLLRGRVTYNRGGLVDCSDVGPTACGSWSQLFAHRDDDLVSVFAEGGRTSLSLSFREQIGRNGPTWYHWMTVLGVDVLSGRLPTLEVRAPAWSPITGSGTFTATESTRTTVGLCPRTTVDGTFGGTFRTRFAGWGARTLVVQDQTASYGVSG